jgi:outer membrane protein assembly factor BamE
MSSKILKLFRLPACMLLALTVNSACGLIYKQNIQQGNALEQKDLDELYIGMNKRQVSFVLGSPSIHDPFQQQRWDYVQTFSRRGGKIVQRTVTLRFEEDLLVEIIGVDKTPSAPAAASSAPQDSASAGADTATDVHTSSVEAGVKEVTEPEIKGLGERNAQDRELEEDEGTVPQGSPDDATAPDSDG